MLAPVRAVPGNLGRRPRKLTATGPKRRVRAFAWFEAADTSLGQTKDYALIAKEYPARNSPHKPV